MLNIYKYLMNKLIRKFLPWAVWQLTLVVVCASVNIPTITWTPRSDWINVKTDVSPTAVGDGVTDDTAAIQAALDTASARGATKKTVYIPAGQYKITSTLYWNSASTFSGVTGVAIVGGGKDTVIQWYGESGGTMFWSKGATRCRYNGITWNGLGTAGIGFYHHSTTTVYETRIRHDNEAFYNFTIAGIQSYGGNGDGTAPAPTAETEITNCLFDTCAIGVYNGSTLPNSYQWIVDGCEFTSCGKGINAPYGKTIVLNTHFEKSTSVDVTTRAGVNQRLRRCTSNQSKAFFSVVIGSTPTATVIQDCRINAWTDTNGAIQMADRGPALIFDCIFTNPPNNNPPIKLSNSSVPYRLTLSNTTCSSLTTLVNAGTNSSTVVETIPAGLLASNVISADQHFLKGSALVDSGTIIDIKSAPYNAAGNGTTDDTTAIQSAINAAISANNGSIVYLPVGNYKITQTLQASGNNFTIQGCGYRSSILTWSGASNGTMLSISTPLNVVVQQIEFSCTNDILAIAQTAAGISSITYDGIFYTHNGNASTMDIGRGIVLSNLPASACVYLDQINCPLNVNDCGQASIFGKYVMGGQLIVQGAVNPKTGFLGIDVFQGGQMTSSNSSYWDVTVQDNQNVVIADYYDEQTFNHIYLDRGNGTDAGIVTIQGIKQHSFTSSSVLYVNNYQGQFMYGPQSFSSPTLSSIIQTGTNSCDIIFLNDTFGAGQPNITLDTGGNLIQTQCLYGPSPYTYMTDIMPTNAPSAISAALDHLRMLGYMDIEWRYVQRAVSNSTFESDTANSSPRTTIGFSPANWTLSASYSNSTGIRQATVVSDGSPFTAGSHGLLLVDYTATTSGSRIQINPALTTTPDSYQSAVFAFDFKLNSTTLATQNTDITVRVFSGSQTQCGLRLRCLGTTASIWGNISGTTTSLSSLQRDAWYRAEALLSPPSSTASSTVKLLLTPYSTGVTATYTLTGATTTSSTGLNSIQFNQAVTGNTTDITLDNIELKTNDPLLAQ
jgi:hypothetical protein